MFVIFFLYLQKITLYGRKAGKTGPNCYTFVSERK